MLVSRDGVVKLADFGASKAYRDTTITDCMKVSTGRGLGKARGGASRTMAVHGEVLT